MDITNFTRQEAVFNILKFNKPIHIIGAGATGSWLTLILAKMGIKDITVYDFDTIEEHNLPNQLYDIKSIGNSKVEELKRLVKEFTNIQINIKNIKVTNNTQLNGIVFLLTDTMSSRKEIWEKSIKFNPTVSLLIETRMDLVGGRVYIINPLNINHIKEYEKTFYTDKESAVSACGASQSIISTALHTCTTAVWGMINYINDKNNYNEILFDCENNVTFHTKY